MKKNLFFAALALCAATAFTSCNSVEDIPQAPNQEQQLPEGTVLKSFKANVPDAVRTRCEDSDWNLIDYDYNFNTTINGNWVCYWQLYTAQNTLFYSGNKIIESSELPNFEFQVPVPENIDLTLHVWLSRDRGDGYGCTYHDYDSSLVENHHIGSSINPNDYCRLPFFDNSLYADSFCAFHEFNGSETESLTLKRAFNQFLILTNEWGDAGSSSIDEVGASGQWNYTADLAFVGGDEDHLLFPTGIDFNSGNVVWQDVTRGADGMLFNKNTCECGNYVHFIDYKGTKYEIVGNFYVFAGWADNSMYSNDGKSSILQSKIIAKLHDTYTLTETISFEIPYNPSTTNCRYIITNRPGSGIFKKDKSFDVQIDQQFSDYSDGAI